MKKISLKILRSGYRFACTFPFLMTSARLVINYTPGLKWLLRRLLPKRPISAIQEMEAGHKVRNKVVWSSKKMMVHQKGNREYLDKITPVCSDFILAHDDLQTKNISQRLNTMMQLAQKRND